MAKVELSSEEKMQIEDAAKTLKKAEEIKSDKKLMAKIHSYLTKEKGVIETISSLKKVAKKKVEVEEDEDSEESEMSIDKMRKMSKKLQAE